MAWYTKLIENFRGNKSKSVSGGFEVLRRLVSSDWRDGAQLEQYRKSLYVFACISKIAEKVASINLTLFRVMNSRGEMKPILTHPVIDLLYKPNAFQTRAEFWETTLINLKATGDAFWIKIRNKGGKVVEIWNMRPDRVTIVTDPVLFIKGYTFAKDDGTQVEIAKDDVVHFKYPDPFSQYLGMSPLLPAQKHVQTADHMTSFQRDFFLNSARPDAVIKNSQSTLTDVQKRDIKEGWRKRFGGVGNTSKVAILEGGLEYQQISISQREMDYIESMKATRDDILVAFKVPKPILSIVEDVNRANSETAMFIFLSETIKPEIARMVEKISEELVIPDFGDDLELGFEDPTPDNRTEDVKEWESALKNGWLLPNEVREMNGLPAITGGWTTYRPISDVATGGLAQAKGKGKIGGDTEQSAFETERKSKERAFDFRGRAKLLQKFQIREMIHKAVEVATNAGKKKKETKGVKGEKKKEVGKPMIPGTLREAYAEIVLKIIDLRAGQIKEGMANFAEEQKGRVMKELDKHKAVPTDHSMKAVKLAEKAPIRVTVEEIFDKVAEDGLAITFITPYLESILKDAGINAMETVNPAENFVETPTVRKLIKSRAIAFADSIDETTSKKLAAALQEGISAGDGIRDLANRVEEVYAEFPAYRSELIARTEATTANNLGMLEAYKQSNVANAKEWINAGDDRVRDEHMDAPQGVGGEIVGVDDNFSNGLQYPQEPNCRCVLGPAFLE